jgi:hypothetical protein
MKKILPFALFVLVVSILSGVTRTSGFNQTQQPNQFLLKASYPMRAGEQDLLATIYETGEGERQKEILSIWSRESYGYELQYIRTAAAGENFLKPAALTVTDLNFVNIRTVGPEPGSNHPAVTLWLAPDSSLHEVSVKHAHELMKIHALAK